MAVCRPYVVSVRWLVDCLKHSHTVEEDDYICYTAAADADDAHAASSSWFASFTTDYCNKVKLF